MNANVSGGGARGSRLLRIDAHYQEILTLVT